MKRYLSYSEMRSYEYGEHEYVNRYLLGVYPEPNIDMKLGTIIHRTIENPEYPWLQEMRAEGFSKSKIMKIRKLINKMYKKRPVQSEVMMTATDANGIELLAILDGFDKETRSMDEFKTSDRDEMWNQHIVNYHRQLDFYAYVYWLKYHQFFKEMRLHFLNTGKSTCQTFYTTRSMRDISETRKRVDTFVQLMMAKGYWERRVSRDDVQKMRNLSLKI